MIFSRSVKNTCLIGTIVTAVSTIGINHAQAVIVTEDFTATVIEGLFAGEVATGTFSYDDDLITGSGFETLDPLSSLTVSMTFLGQTYDQTDDVNFDTFPQLDFLDGIPVFLDYFIVDGSPTDIENPNIGALFIAEPFTINGDGNFETTLAVIPPVPESSNIIGLATLATLGLTTAFKRKLGQGK